MKKNTKRKIKDTLFKVLHIVCYILSGIFILTLLFGGLNSCKNSKNNSLSQPIQSLKVNDTNYDYTILNNPTYDSDTYNVGDSQFNWTDYYFDNAVHNEQLGNQVIYLNDFGYYYNDYGTPLKIGFVKLSFTEVKIGNIYRFYFEQLDLEYDYIANGGGITTDFVTVVSNDNDYDVYYFNKDDFAFDLYVITQYNCPILSYFYYYDLQTYFNFNTQINYNATNGGTLGNKYLNSITYDTVIASTIYRKTYNTGLFISNNKLYESIVVDFQLSDGLIFVDDNGRKFTHSGGYSYFALGYKIYNSNLIDFVNYRDSKTFYNSTDGDFNATIDSSTWINQSYKNITFLQNLTNDVKTKIESFNNNGLSTGTSIYNGSVGDVFTLIGLGFTSIMPILSIVILPGFTLGMLIFIPLVVLIVFVIIKIIHK